MKNMKLSEKLKEKNKTVYTQVAEEFHTTTLYVGQIARNERIPQRGKGLQIKQRLLELAGN